MTETHPSREAAMQRATELRKQGYRVRIARKGYPGFLSQRRKATNGVPCHGRQVKWQLDTH